MYLSQSHWILHPRRFSLSKWRIGTTCGIGTKSLDLSHWILKSKPGETSRPIAKATKNNASFPTCTGHFEEFLFWVLESWGIHVPALMIYAQWKQIRLTAWYCNGSKSALNCLKCCKILAYVHYFSLMLLLTWAFLAKCKLLADLLCLQAPSLTSWLGFHHS